MTSLPSQTIVPTATGLGRFTTGAVAVGEREVLVTQTIMADARGGSRTSREAILVA